MPTDDVSPEIARMEAQLDNLSTRADDPMILQRIRHDVESRAAAAPGGRFRPGRGAAWLVAAVLPVAAAAAIAVALLSHRQAVLPGPTGPHSPTPAASAAPSIQPSPVAVASFLESIQMKSASSGWATTGGPGQGVAHTTDGGRTWVVVRLLGEPHPSFFVSATEAWVVTGGPPSAGALAGALPTPAGVDHTTDGGATWSRGTPFATAGAPSSLQMRGMSGWLSTERSAAGAGGEIFTTTDGVSWNRTSAPPTCAGLGRALLSFLSDRRTGFLTDFCDNSSEPVLQVTRDGGRSWSAIHLPAPRGYRRDPQGFGSCVAEQPVFFDRLHGFVAGACGFTTGANPLQFPALYATADGGATWLARTTPAVGSLQMTSTSSGYLFGVSQAYAYTFYRTHDGGMTWVKPVPPPFINSEGNPIDLTFIDSSTGWAVVMGTKLERDMWMTRDGGNTWEDLHTKVSEPVQVSPTP